MSTQSPRASFSGSVTRQQTVRAYLHRWAETAGAQLLVVDPMGDDGALSEAMAGRGVHVTWVTSTIDGLVEFGRTDPHAVLLAPDAPGIAPAEFVGAIRRHGSPYVIAGAVDPSGAESREVGALILAGASAVVLRPYAAPHLWELLSHAPRSLAEHARLEVGPIVLDATAYSVRVHGERIADLPLKEFELLRALMLRAPGVVSDDELRDALWGTASSRPGGNTIAMHVTRLRSRLHGAAVVRRIRGRGYSLTPDPD
ncbi:MULTISPECIES: winged helix-turn-helix transcriptional regulator [Nocardioides]|uniref:Winged-helix domain-containing protein n=1 Tax=Nocardioides vastitatis TaxID=2568655 RepID=A0ABW0Z8T9_9ACTN|nr:winged helix-turn-helix domain-containing protein [Nocardioides sp.]THJ02353.1 response regulator transcription factor [Nocardioides sp.]